MFTYSLFPVPFCVAPDDYTAISPQPLTFSSAPDSMCISINISDDMLEEPTESFAVTLNSTDPAVNFSMQNATVTIINETSKYTPSFCSLGRHMISLCIIISIAVTHTVYSWTKLALDRISFPPIAKHERAQSWLA